MISEWLIAPQKHHLLQIYFSFINSTIGQLCKYSQKPKHTFNNVLFQSQMHKKLIRPTLRFDYEIISRGEKTTSQFCQRLLRRGSCELRLSFDLIYWADGHWELKGSKSRSRKSSMECRERVEPHLKEGNGVFFSAFPESLTPTWMHKCSATKTCLDLKLAALMSCVNSLLFTVRYT